MSAKGHSVRALAFHHEKGYEAQRKLALDFAGKDGRIATVEDIVNARLNSNIKDFAWWGTFITGSALFHGTDKNKNPLLVFTHGNALPPMVALSDTKAIRDFYKQFDDPGVTHRDETPVLEQEEFQKLVDGHYGEVAVVNLNTYKSTAIAMNRIPGDRTTGKASNRYSHEEAKRDEIARAFFGREFDAFLDHYYSLAREWMKDTESAEMLKTLPLITNRLYSVYESLSSEKRHAPRGYATMHPLTIERGGLYTSHKGERYVGEIDFSVATNSGIDDLGGPAFFIVGVRGKKPITEITSDFRMVASDVRVQWPKFVQPLAEVPNDPYVGIKPDGSRKQPYFVPSVWGSAPECTGRVLEDLTEAPMPEYRIKSWKKVDGPTSVIFKSKYPHPKAYKYQHEWAHAEGWKRAVAQMPKGANAISTHGRREGGGTIEVYVSYLYIEVYPEPFAVLTKCGDRLFSQYYSSNGLTHQPYRPTKEAVELKKETIEVPEKPLKRASGSGRGKWSIESWIISQAPETANAVLIENHWHWHDEKKHRNCLRVDVTYYKVTYEKRAFRPFTELRADFDWQLKRRAEAGLLKIAA